MPRHTHAHTQAPRQRVAKALPDSAPLLLLRDEAPEQSRPTVYSQGKIATVSPAPPRFSYMSCSTLGSSSPTASTTLQSSVGGPPPSP